jgi:hypothetical protein
VTKLGAGEPFPRGVVGHRVGSIHVAVRTVAVSAFLAIAAWACVATVLWQHARIERFWALRDLKDQRRDFDALTEEARDLRARVHVANDWNATLLACHRKAIDEMLADLQAHRPVVNPIDYHFPCDRLDL